MEIKERTIVIGCKLDGVDYNFGVKIDDFDDPEILLGAIEQLPRYIISQIMEHSDVFDNTLIKFIE